MKLFRGSGVAIVTPFKEGQVDYEAFEKLILWHIKEQTDAIIVCGTTGESATLSHEEKVEIYRFSHRIGHQKIQIIAGTGSNDTKTAIELSVAAKEAGVDALLVVTPYYNKPTQKGLYAHYKAIHNAVNMPIILYNVPSRTASNLLPETVYELSKLEHIQAIKEASGDISQVAKVIELCGDSFIVYSGNDDQTMPILALGGQGVISVTANIIPKTIHEQTMRYLSGDVEVVKESLSYRELHQVMFIESNPTPVKAALNAMGISVGGVRLPLVEMEEMNVQTLLKTLEKFGLVGMSS